MLTEVTFGSLKADEWGVTGLVALRKLRTRWRYYASELSEVSTADDSRYSWNKDEGESGLRGWLSEHWMRRMTPTCSPLLPASDWKPQFSLWTGQARLSRGVSITLKNNKQTQKQNKGSIFFCLFTALSPITFISTSSPWPAPSRAWNPFSLLEFALPSTFH